MSSGRVSRLGLLAVHTPHFRILLIETSRRLDAVFPIDNAKSAKAAITQVSVV